ncbi:MAG: cytochrome P450 [Halobacteriales archaeon]|nr:cytochrome P450 [Halobacteriales archaeon]
MPAPKTAHGAKPPGPPQLTGAKNLLRVVKDPVVYLTELHERYGDVAYLRFGRQQVYLVSDPDLIREVLVAKSKSFTKGKALQSAKRLLGEGLLTSEGELHDRQRRIMQPHFHHQRIKGYSEVMVDYARRARDSWKPGQEVDIAAEMMQLTLRITGKTLFDVDIVDEDPELGAALAGSLDVFNELALPVSGILDKLPLPRKKRFQEAKERLDQRIFSMMEERRKDPEGHHDMLTMLVTAEDEQGTGGMSPERIRDEAVTIFLAGHETTAQALTWTFYLLSQNPDAEHQLRQELHEVLGGRLPALEDVPKLRFTRWCMQEAMRIYPPAWVLGRIAIEPVELGGWKIPKGAILLLSQVVMHRDPRYWPGPMNYLPERWAKEDPERPRYAYFPFGGGPRVCIGEPFAWMEGTLVIATLMQTWSPALVPGHKVALQPTLTLKPKHGMRMTLRSAA